MNSFRMMVRLNRSPLIYCTIEFFSRARGWGIRVGGVVHQLFYTLSEKHFDLISVWDFVPAAGIGRTKMPVIQNRFFQ